MGLPDSSRRRANNHESGPYSLGCLVKETFIVVGLGQIGRPLLELAGESFTAIGVDLEPTSYDGPCDVMHVCYPGGSPSFVDDTVAYITRYRPGVTVINSTVPVGTTRQITELSASAVVFSPVRGKHHRMLRTCCATPRRGRLTRCAALVADHFRRLAMTTRVVSSPEAGLAAHRDHLFGCSCLAQEWRGTAKRLPRLRRGVFLLPG